MSFLYTRCKLLANNSMYLIIKQGMSLNRPWANISPLNNEGKSFQNTRSLGVPSYSAKHDLTIAIGMINRNIRQTL